MVRPQCEGKKCNFRCEIVTISAISFPRRNREADPSWLTDCSTLSRFAFMMYSLLFALVFVAAVIAPVFVTMRTRAAKD